MAPGTLATALEITSLAIQRHSESQIPRSLEFSKGMRAQELAGEDLVGEVTADFPARGTNPGYFA